MLWVKTTSNEYYDYFCLLISIQFYLIEPNNRIPAMQLFWHLHICHHAHIWSNLAIEWLIWKVHRYSWIGSIGSKKNNFRQDGTRKWPRLLEYWVENRFSHKNGWFSPLETFKSWKFGFPRFGVTAEDNDLYEPIVSRQTTLLERLRKSFCKFSPQHFEPAFSLFLTEAR